ncbi:hypothetical protein L6R52_42840, partial [Myxococcota bacterium]|nr:hypothetical protein [Myxococcota bacterium]
LGGLDDDMPPPAAAKKPSGAYGPGVPKEDDLALEPPPHARSDTPPPSRPAAPAAAKAGDALDFIDSTADRAGVKPTGGSTSTEYRVRRRNGRIEGPFGLGRIVAMLKNKEFTGGEDISEDGLSWRSMTSNRELNQVINDLASADDALSFGNVDFGGDVAAPGKVPSKIGPAATPSRGAPSKPSPASGGGLELSSPLDGLSAGGGASELDLGGLDDDMPPPAAAKKPSGAYGPGVPKEDDLALEPPPHARSDTPPPR